MKQIKEKYEVRRLKAEVHRGNGRPARLEETESRSKTSTAHGRDARAPWMPALLSSSAFSLIEVLVASAILAMLLAVFLSVADYVSKAWTNSQEKMENFSKARVVMNRIRSDMETIVIRSDLPLFPGGTNLEFFTLKRGPAAAGLDPRPLSYAGYSWDSASGDVIRLSKAYVLADVIPFGTTNAPAGLTTNTLAGGVIGFKTVFLNQDGSWDLTFNSKASTNTNTNAAGQTDSQNPSVAVRISLLAVSQSGLRHLLIQPAGKNLTNLVPYMEVGMDPINPTYSPEYYWNTRMSGIAGTFDPRVARSLRSFERTFFLQLPN